MGTITPDRTVIVTTSWDDGHPSDMRLAELLGSYAMKGTFYIPIRNGNNPILNRNGIVALKKMGMEIGSHTLSHAILTNLTKDRVLHEMSESKRILEDMCGEVITSFCYPGGKYNRTACAASREAGYKLARSTRAFRTEIQLDPFCMPVSFQFFRHTHSIHMRHALKEGNLKGITSWVRYWRMENDLVKLADKMFQYVLNNGGALHIWGHSWEIEKHGLWQQLRSVLHNVAHQEGVRYLTNSQMLDVTNR